MSYQREIFELKERLTDWRWEEQDRSGGNVLRVARELASKYRKSVHQVLVDIGRDGVGNLLATKFIRFLSALATEPARSGTHYLEEYDHQLHENAIVPTDGQAYFAFVEDRNNFRFYSPKELPEEARGWEKILEARNEFRLEPATNVVWLDAIEADYFLDIPWRDERCEIGDIQAGLRRRELLGTLEEKRRRVIVAPLTKKLGFEGSCLENFLPCSWHLVVLTKQGRTPVASLPDFDIDNYPDEPAQYLHYAGRLREDEYNSVENVFNLNFLPEIRERAE